jgi:predicted transposase/invertase (TIGR01784 family)
VVKVTSPVSQTGRGGDSPDLVIKKIFGDQDHKGCLIDFLNAVLERTEENRIVDIAHLPSDQIPAIKGFKYTLVDVRCKDAKREEYIVEMQIAASNFFSRRVFYYASTST